MQWGKPSEPPGGGDEVHRPQQRGHGAGAPARLAAHQAGGQAGVGRGHLGGQLCPAWYRLKTPHGSQDAGELPQIQVTMNNAAGLKGCGAET